MSACAHGAARAPISARPVKSCAERSHFGARTAFRAVKSSRVRWEHLFLIFSSNFCFLARRTSQSCNKASHHNGGEQRGRLMEQRGGSLLAVVPRPVMDGLSVATKRSSEPSAPPGRRRATQGGRLGRPQASSVHRRPGALERSPYRDGNNRIKTIQEEPFFPFCFIV